jgi:hypothetical protein
MDMGDKAPRRGAANLGMPLMIVAFLTMIGFLYWLNLQARKQDAEEQAALAEQAAADSAEADLGAITIDPSALQMDASPYEGQVVKMEGLPVASGLGQQGFWLEMPNKNPFLVSMTDAVRAEGVTVSQGQRATVVGTIRAMSDSVLDAWSTAGTISEGDRLAAEFATYYLDAARVNTDAATSGGGGSGSAAGDGGAG